MTGLTARGSGAAPRFPEGFVWGASTSSYQIEGGVDEDGRGRSIWDVFTHTNGNIRRGDTGDIACDSYHRMDEDLRLLSELGVGAYRFSIAWPRVQPTGQGRVNPAGLDYYRMLIEELRSRDIMPVATIYHWELPQALEDRGGWASRDTAERLAEYAALLARELGDQVGMWLTVNEPKQSVHQGYRIGTHAPGHRDAALAAAATHHILLGHGLALQALRSELPDGGTVGLALDPHPYRPAGDGPAGDGAGAGPAGDGAGDVVIQLDADHNRIFLDPVIRGAYPLEARPELLPPDELVRQGDMELIGAPVDFIGLNYYRPHYIRRGDWSDLRAGETPVAEHPGFVEYLPAELPRTVMDWLVEPDSLYDLLMRLHTESGGTPLYITENGCAADDYVNPEGEVNDVERIDYIHGHLDAALRAIGDGVNLAGYFHWALMDNFEWAFGYQRRFGLYYVDFETQRRTAKRSATFYERVVRSGELPALVDGTGSGYRPAGAGSPH